MAVEAQMSDRRAQAARATGRGGRSRWGGTAGACLCCLCMAAFGLPGNSLAGTAGAPLTKTAELGPVKVTVQLEPAKPLIGDPVTLTLIVSAEQGVELLLPEFGESLERFAILDFVPRQTIDDRGRTVATQKYRLQPPSSGRQAIPPILVEFVDRRPGQRKAPEGQDAYELYTERIEFEVQSVLPKDVRAELRPPMGKLGPLQPPPAPRWPWALAAAVLAAAVSLLAARAGVAWRRRARRRSAYDIARARLERLLASLRPDAEHVDAFFVELSGIVRRYLEDRFELRAPELTTEEFLESVQRAPDLSREHQSLLRGFLRQADLVKFAGARPPAEEIERSVAAARRFLEETRENAPLLEMSGESAAARASAGGAARQEPSRA